MVANKPGSSLRMFSISRESYFGYFEAEGSDRSHSQGEVNSQYLVSPSLTLVTLKLKVLTALTLRERLTLNIS
jgi:hypothetical protein